MKTALIITGLSIYAIGAAFSAAYTFSSIKKWQIRKFGYVELTWVDYVQSFIVAPIFSWVSALATYQTYVKE